MIVDLPLPLVPIIATLSNGFILNETLSSDFIFGILSDTECPPSGCIGWEDWEDWEISLLGYSNDTFLNSILPDMEKSFLSPFVIVSFKIYFPFPFFRKDENLSDIELNVSQSIILQCRTFPNYWW